METLLRMSDDGTQAAKKIAYAIQFDATLAQAYYLLEKMVVYWWSGEQEKELREMGEKLIALCESSDELIESFYKVIGEA